MGLQLTHSTRCSKPAGRASVDTEGPGHSSDAEAYCNEAGPSVNAAGLSTHCNRVF